MVLGERSVRLSNLLKRKRAVNVNFERSSFNQSIQFVDRFAAAIAIVCIASHLGGGLAPRLPSVGRRAPPRPPDRGPPPIPPPPPRRNQSGIDAVWCKLASDFQNVVATTIHYGVRAQTFDECHPI